MKISVEYLKKHHFVILLGIVVSLLCFLPQYWLERDLGDDYEGVYFSVTDSENYYGSRVGEIYDGHLGLGNAHLAEYKVLPYLQPPLPEIVYAGFGKLVGWDRVEAILYGSRVVFPFILTLVIYSFVYSVSKSRLQSLLATAFIILGQNLLLNPMAILDLARGESKIFQALVYSRPVSPQFHSIFFFGYLALFWQWLETRTDKYLWWAAVLLGFLFYIYFYSWTFIFAFLAVLFLISFFKKDFILRKKLILHAILALAIAIPYFYNLYQFYQLPQREFLGTLQGLVSGRSFVFSELLVAGTVFFFISFWRKFAAQFWFFTALLLAGFIAINQQIITGQELFSPHYHWYINAPLVGIVLVMGFFELLHLQKHKKLAVALVCLGLAGFVFNGYVAQRNTYEKNQKYFVADQRYATLYDWLNLNTPKDSVVLTFSPYVGDNLPVYTHNNVFMSVQLMLNNTPEERIKDAYYLRIYFLDVKADEADEFFRGNPSIVADLLGGVANRRKYGCRTCFPESEFGPVIEGYKKFLEQGIEKQLDKYRLDYLVEDTSSDIWPAGILDRYKKIAEVGEFVVYKK
ncbi:MAG: hypothetical protein A2826_02690 [Candidatus Doudnabacteria bacterium RIFCSPHIGHO2_01_FULL_43_23]|uniref:Glycosyltransferase RgtA/B/C/D-like domain-containing protein n=1 Tax=Candidatus Doudnabacteria bacterium RIFCSPHIGHO2_01_FULL_43_23 TaxID=1817822 RepID=A0A1F5NRS8_9BACT|nr:MAG: hypothetical protein A2826_02690 [Candidatus Doudnabacteria bacterium RIFCSPHIGHO2_01_FULL_43_23]